MDTVIVAVRITQFARCEEDGKNWYCLGLQMNWSAEFVVKGASHSQPHLFCIPSVKHSVQLCGI
ncbi:hypothetical protein ABO04_02165 [Nitrosomonas sp. HPC101]|nr:hypothetical protein [Nitrosomonas sp. HPC101]